MNDTIASEMDVSCQEDLIPGQNVSVILKALDILSYFDILVLF